MTATDHRVAVEPNSVLIGDSPARPILARGYTQQRRTINRSHRQRDFLTDHAGAGRRRFDHELCR